jgi:hypothetical protein
MTAKPRLGAEPLIHPSAEVVNCELGRYTEVAERCSLSETRLGDYSYIMQDGMVWAAEIGKFANIAAYVRINATKHPTWRATLHHFTYRSNDYWPDSAREESFFDWRRDNKVVVGHDVWIGHGAVLLPGVKVGNGAVIGSNAVVTKAVAPYTIVAGVPAKLIKFRFYDDVCERMDELAWWDWSHERLRDALGDFRALSAEAFLEKYGA